jgi:hypothetical protein
MLDREYPNEFSEFLASEEDEPGSGNKHDAGSDNEVSKPLAITASASDPTLSSVEHKVLMLNSMAGGDAVPPSPNRGALDATQELVSLLFFLLSLPMGRHLTHTPLAR